MPTITKSLPFHRHVAVLFHTVEENADVTVEHFMQHLKDGPQFLRPPRDRIYDSDDFECHPFRISGRYLDNGILVVVGGYLETGPSLGPRHQQ